MGKQLKLFEDEEFINHIWYSLPQESKEKVETLFAKILLKLLSFPEQSPGTQDKSKTIKEVKHHEEQ